MGKARKPKPPRLTPPTLNREMGRCSVCPAGSGDRDDVEIISIEHKEAPMKDIGDGVKIRQWFGFCLRCARMVGRKAARR